jgi:hypothetical protein
MGPEQINFNPTTFLSHNEDRMCEKVWTLPPRFECRAMALCDRKSRCAGPVVLPLAGVVRSRTTMVRLAGLAAHFRRDLGYVVFRRFQKPDITRVLIPAENDLVGSNLNSFLNGAPDLL